ncbi:hypothetical protein [Methylocaldum sp.]|uniref:hypothetical protein n=1 Tax=Methylocaldum sp. TaxID=1969727 RepID=UPI002D6F5DA8|nr:hypothetical protein [Methylocaldum sp.]HYE35549.1 hypothetical protein [Methylocaldum sp.]
MSDQSTSQWKILNVLLIGVLIPLVAAAVPWLLERISLPHDLQYTFSGPVTTKAGFAYSVVVDNKGKQPENDLEVWLPVPATARLDYDFQKDGRFIKSETKPIVQVEVSIPSTQKISGEDKRVLIVEIPSLRPNESASISVLAAGGDIGYLADYQLKQLRIVSKDAVGKLNEPDEALEFLYKVGSWLFLMFFVFLISYGVYYEYFMPHEKKEKYLLEQIDKLGKRKP